MSQVILDVRETDEFDAEHIANSIHIPLGTFATKAPPILKCLAGQEVLLICKGGKRAQMAADQVAGFKLGASPTVKVYEGGIMEWKAKGNATECKKTNHLPIMRQVQIVAGLLVLSSTVASVAVSPALVYVAMFVGAGLTFAGISGFCTMAIILSKMPWNKGC